jgi:hypothetical protein
LRPYSFRQDNLNQILIFIFTAMELDRFEYEMLDAVLEAFGQQDSLTREQILDIFDHDEDYAASMVSFLESNGLITVVGNKLPLVINKGPKVVTFLENGGFAGSSETMAEKIESIPAPDQFQEQNLQTPDEKPSYERIIKEHNARIKLLELSVKRFEHLKYLLGAALIVILALAFWIIRLMPHHRH